MDFAIFLTVIAGLAAFELAALRHGADTRDGFSRGRRR